ncbi:MAG: histidine phosphatase family protein [Candidatus Fermentithermobacillus carboniphilus]|uniref:Histidine phosphatase family protein n=1 Tax=Candidatus Fermentithermobacillus carboniphilus TaxID=3085328 RepID=A0AAT9LAW5_9FIRM|nr:MAG: histidine phosphatase family protein [Candidatus Fermentithermobacillus carboniphilus]
MGTYYIVRHGETEANQAGILQGHLNVPLSDRGRKQAEAVASRLRSVKIDVIYTSDLDRAKDTAMAIAKYHNCKLILDRRLREVHCGILQGKTMAECREKYPELFERFKQDPIGTERPGGESYKDLFDRTTRALEDIYERYPDSNVVIVTHGGPIRCLLAYASGKLVDPGSPTPNNASISIITRDENGWSVEKFNDVDHLEPLGDDIAKSNDDAYRW